MAKEHSPAFDAGAYWRDRVISGSDLGIVGHRSMGLAYNAQIYERRLEALNAMVRRCAPKPVAELRVLDIGCGSGFYTGFWAESGVRDYVGVDISTATVEYLSESYPDYQFVAADITEEVLPNLSIQQTFDVVTIFDVFYHIVDDKRFANAVRHVGSLTGETGVVLVMDQLCRERYQLSKHVVYRDRRGYAKLFEQARLELIESELLFHFLVPPLSGYRPVDYVSAGLFKAAGLLMRLSDRFAGWVATRLRRLDARLRSSGKHVSNSEMFAFRKNGA